MEKTKKKVKVQKSADTIEENQRIKHVREKDFC